MHHVFPEDRRLCRRGHLLAARWMLTVGITRDTWPARCPASAGTSGGIISTRQSKKTSAKANGERLFISDLLSPEASIFLVTGMHNQCQRLSRRLFFTGYSPVLPGECPADLMFDRARQTLTRRAQPHSISSLCRKKVLFA